MPGKNYPTTPFGNYRKSIRYYLKHDFYYSVEETKGINALYLRILFESKTPTRTVAEHLYANRPILVTIDGVTNLKLYGWDLREER